MRGMGAGILKQTPVIRVHRSLVIMVAIVGSLAISPCVFADHPYWAPAHGYYSKHHHFHQYGDDDDSSDDESSGHGYKRYSYDYDVHHHDHYYDGDPFDDEAHEVEYEW